MAATPYQGYRPLDVGERQIRLLKISRSPENESQVHGTLQTASLKDVSKHQLPQYCALSWYWGMPGRTKPLILDGTVLQIRENLYSSLLALTGHVENGLVWIDAICIDQYNEVEKSAQVTMMAEIYKNATRVIAWLGEDDADSNLAFESVKCRAEFQTQNTSLPASIQDEYHSFQMIFSRPYWTRLWTLQERAVATQLWILCGNQIARWNELKERFLEIKGELRQDYLPGFGPEAQNALQELPSQTQNGDREPLVGLMRNFRALQCKDTRDKAYALRALAADGADLPIDYRKPALHVFFDILSLPHPRQVPSSLEDDAVRASKPGLDDTQLLRIFKDARQLLPCFPLTEGDIVPFITSDVPKPLDLRVVQPGEEDRLCAWLPCRYASTNGSYIEIEYSRSGSYSHGEERTIERGPERQETVHYRCSSKLKRGDICIGLDDEVSPLEGAVAIVRPDSDSGLEPVGLAFAFETTRRYIMPSEEQIRFYLGPIARTTLQLLWSKGHIYLCNDMPLPKRRAMAFDFRMHFSRLAFLAHLAIALLPRPQQRGPFDGDLQFYFQSAAQEAEEMRPHAPGHCSEQLQALDLFRRKERWSRRLIVHYTTRAGEDNRFLP